MARRAWKRSSPPSPADRWPAPPPQAQLTARSRKGGCPMSAPSAASPAASADRRAGGPPALSLGPLARMAEGTLAMAQAEMRKLRHDHLDIITRSVQPLLWLFIFGTALRNNS